MTASILSPKKNKTRSRTLDLPSGRRISVSPEPSPEGQADRGPGERVRIHEPDGRVLVELTLTPEGPLLSLKGARLALSATREISLDADCVTIRSNKDLTLESRGTARIRAQKDASIESEGDIRITGKLIHLN